MQVINSHEVYLLRKMVGRAEGIPTELISLYQLFATGVLQFFLSVYQVYNKAHSRKKHAYSLAKSFSENKSGILSSSWGCWWSCFPAQLQASNVGLQMQYD